MAVIQNPPPIGECLARDYMRLETWRQKLDEIREESLRGIECRQSVEACHRSLLVTRLDKQIEVRGKETERIQQRNDIFRQQCARHLHEATARLPTPGRSVTAVPGDLGDRVRDSRQAYVKQVETLSTQWHKAIELQMKNEIQAAREDAAHCVARQQDTLEAACRQEQLLQDLRLERERARNERQKLYRIDGEVQDRQQRLFLNTTHAVDRGAAQGLAVPTAGAYASIAHPKVKQSSSPSVSGAEPTLMSVPLAATVTGTISGEPCRDQRRNIQSERVQRHCRSLEDGVTLECRLPPRLENGEEYVPPRHSRQFDVYQRLRSYEMEMQSDLRILEMPCRPVDVPSPSERPSENESSVALRRAFEQPRGPPLVLVGACAPPLPMPAPSRSAPCHPVGPAKSTVTSALTPRQDTTTSRTADFPVEDVQLVQQPSISVDEQWQGRHQQQQQQQQLQLHEQREQFKQLPLLDQSQPLQAATATFAWKDRLRLGLSDQCQSTMANALHPQSQSDVSFAAAAAAGGRGLPPEDRAWARAPLNRPAAGLFEFPPLLAPAHEEYGCADGLGAGGAPRACDSRVRPSSVAGSSVGGTPRAPDSNVGPSVYAGRGDSLAAGGTPRASDCCVGPSIPAGPSAPPPELATRLGEPTAACSKDNALRMVSQPDHPHVREEDNGLRMVAQPDHPHIRGEDNSLRRVPQPEFPRIREEAADRGTNSIGVAAADDLRISPSCARAAPIASTVPILLPEAPSAAPEAQPLSVAASIPSSAPPCMWPPPIEQPVKPPTLQIHTVQAVSGEALAVSSRSAPSVDMDAWIPLSARGRPVTTVVGVCTAESPEGEEAPPDPLGCSFTFAEVSASSGAAAAAAGSHPPAPATAAATPPSPAEPVRGGIAAAAAASLAAKRRASASGGASSAGNSGRNSERSFVGGSFQGEGGPAVLQRGRGGFCDGSDSTSPNASALSPGLVVGIGGGGDAFAAGSCCGGPSLQKVANSISSRSAGEACGSSFQRLEDSEEGGVENSAASTLEGSSGYSLPPKPQATRTKTNPLGRIGSFSTLGGFGGSGLAASSSGGSLAASMPSPQKAATPLAAKPKAKVSSSKPSVLQDDEDDDIGEGDDIDATALSTSFASRPAIIGGSGGLVGLGSLRRSSTAPLSRGSVSSLAGHAGRVGGFSGLTAPIDWSQASDPKW